MGDHTSGRQQGEPGQGPAEPAPDLNELDEAKLSGEFLDTPEARAARKAAKELADSEKFARDAKIFEPPPNAPSTPTPATEDLSGSALEDFTIETLPDAPSGDVGLDVDTPATRARSEPSDADKWHTDEQSASTHPDDLPGGPHAAEPAPKAVPDDRPPGPPAQRPNTQEKPGTGAPERRMDRPRTQEKPGTGAKDPKPERPRERPTGQITDESGEYGPERTWDPGTTDWNKANRAGGAKAAAAVIGAVLLVGIGVVFFGPLRGQPPASSPAPPTADAPARPAPTTAPATAGPRLTIVSAAGKSERTGTRAGSCISAVTFEWKMTGLESRDHFVIRYFGPGMPRETSGAFGPEPSQTGIVRVTWTVTTEQALAAGAAGWTAEIVNVFRGSNDPLGIEGERTARAPGVSC